jgi:DNA-directed RNA polymerase specialized sigma24 family protein
VDELGGLLEQVLAGSDRAWQRFFLRYGSKVELIAKRARSLGSLREQVDDCRNVMTRVFERLRRDDFRALRLYLQWQQRNTTRQFDDWLTVVTTNVARDYVEERLGAARDQPIKRLLNTLAGALEDSDEALAVGAHLTPKLAAQQIMAFAAAELPEIQLAVLKSWLLGNDFESIGAELSVSVDDAKRHLRAGLARLRRKLADNTT